jgi:heme-degrading monooxygenase HmoA
VRSPSAAGAKLAAWLPWQPGPASERDHERAAVVSVTDFRAHQARDLPRIYLSGLRLREGWYAMPGAIGLWLWSEPLNKGRGGSVSIWESEADLRRFVALPAHVAIMRRYRTLGTLRSTTWQMERFTRSAAREAAERTIEAWSVSPAS